MRNVLAGLLLLFVALSSGCAFRIVPMHPDELHYCVPAKSWRCNPFVPFSDMSYDGQ